ncbi:hypothetical protein GOP47_0018776 [Adiantum capillus-veneris]|nr:hypothetical protein GOP47_0018776 [Adiantum capillus-veneris]
MTEIGEALAKLRRQVFTDGPFFNFEQEVSALLEYIYNTQLEYAACAEDLCITMDGSKDSYRLLGNFAAGQPLYEIHKAENDDLYICFKSPYSSNHTSNDSSAVDAKVKVPVLTTTGEDFCRL